MSKAVIEACIAAIAALTAALQKCVDALTHPEMSRAMRMMQTQPCAWQGPRVDIPAITKTINDAGDAVAAATAAIVAEIPPA